MKKVCFLLCIVFYGGLFSVNTTFLLIRHGETDWNIEERAQGRTNNPLNAKGILQAKELAKKIRAFYPDISAIYSSDLDRAYATAQETASLLQLGVSKRVGLREVDNGWAEGFTWDEEKLLYGAKLQELNDLYPCLKERWDHTHIPNAETNNQLLSRIKNELVSISNLHPGEKIAIFAHGEIIRVLISDVLDKEISSLPNCSITCVIHHSNDYRYPFTIAKIE